jgi:hypothetical protein
MSDSTIGSSGWPRLAAHVAADQPDMASEGERRLERRPAAVGALVATGATAVRAARRVRVQRDLAAFGGPCVRLRRM